MHDHKIDARTFPKEGIMSLDSQIISMQSGSHTNQSAARLQKTKTHIQKKNIKRKGNRPAIRTEEIKIDLAGRW